MNGKLSFLHNNNSDSGDETHVTARTCDMICLSSLARLHSQEFSTLVSALVGLYLV